MDPSARDWNPRLGNNSRVRESGPLTPSATMSLLKKAMRAAKRQDSSFSLNARGEVQQLIPNEDVRKRVDQAVSISCPC